MHHVVTGTVKTQSAADALSDALVSILIAMVDYPLISIVALMRVEVDWLMQAEG